MAKKKKHKKPKLNNIFISGVVSTFETVATGKRKKGGGKWELFRFDLEDVESAGQAKDDDGILSFTTFEDVSDYVDEGDVIGVQCRAKGRLVEYNKDGEEREFVSVELSATSDIDVIESADDDDDEDDDDEDEAPKKKKSKSKKSKSDNKRKKGKSKSKLDDEDDDDEDDDDDEADTKEERGKPW